MRSQPSAGREALILDLWERAVGLDRWARDQALLPHGPAPSRSLGARNVALLELRNALFDPTWTLSSDCPACATPCEFAIDGRRLAAELTEQGTARTARLEWAGRALTARAPTLDDLAAIAEQPDEASAVRALVARCMVGDVDLDPETLDGAAIDALGEHLERLDPAAVVTFALCCPTCQHAWSSALDVAEALWAELQRAAESTLLEVDALARTYGWTEDEVLRLSPIRRAAYVQLAEGG